MNLVLRYAMAFVAMLMFGFKAQAQQMWGAGLYGGAGMCNYNYQIGENASEVADRIDEEKNILKEMEKELNDKKKELNEAKRNMDKAINTFTRSGYTKGSSAYSLIERQINNPRDCGTYQQDANDKNERCSKFGDTSCQTKITPEPTEPFSQTIWKNVCDISNKVVKGEICRQKVDGQMAYKYEASECEKALNDWQKHKKEVAQLTEEVNQRKIAVTNQKKYINRDLKKEYTTAVKEHQQELRDQMTEGGCVDCMIAGSGGGVYKPYKPSGWEIAANVALGVGAMYLGKQMTQYVSDNNAKLGFATQAPPSFGYGFPYFMGAAYGAIGGGIGMGAFGCGGGMGGTGYGMGPYGMMGPYGLAGLYGPAGGAFGYPAGMYPSPFGGGMFMPGMGPWGMAGPWGLNGGMMGGLGMMGGPGGMMGMMGYPGGGMMGMPGMMGGMMGYPGMMGMMGGPGGMMGYPGMMGGMMGGLGMMGMMGGAGMMGYPGGMMGMMGGAGMMGYPGMMGMMGMMGGAGMMGYPGMMGMMGYPGGGMMGMMGGAGMMGLMGGPGGMMGMMGGPGGMMGMMGMMGGDGGMMQMQMYMQMMQMQMQQSQMMMQMQMRRYENYMAGQRVVGGLYQELYTLMYRIQAAQMSMQSGGFGMDFGISGSMMGGMGMMGGGAMMGTPMPGMPPGGMPGSPYMPGGPMPAPGAPTGGVPTVR